MLHGIDPLLTGELLWRLDAMGHADSIAIVDAHFPQLDEQRLLVFAGVGAPALIRAICTVLPLDPEIAPAMMIAPDGPLTVQRELADAAGVAMGDVELLARAAYYERARSAAVVLRTGEVRPYGNAILSKGIVS